MKPCECGCGEIAKNRFIHGHNSNGITNPFYGKSHTDETKSKISEFMIGKTGANSPAFKGGKWIHERGYVVVLVGKNHPMADRDGYCYEHRLVMSEHLGRNLSSEEVVHHIGDKNDNRIENLKLFANHSEHMLYEGELNGSKIR